MRRVMKAAILALAALAVASTAASASKRPKIVTGDVERFFRVYDAAHGHPTAAQLDKDYLAPGSAELHRFAQLRNVTGARMTAAIEKRPEIYVEARKCMGELPRVKTRLTVAFNKLAQLYPEAKFPPVTFVIGRGRPVGVTDPSGVYMGVEALCSANFMDPNLNDRFVHNIAHEYGHVQQTGAYQNLNPGDPDATVLTMSLMEGVGEFTAELISGAVGNYQHKAWTKGHEAEIEQAFVRDEASHDLTPWMYNGPGDAQHPGDLGYWVGYRIVKSYYEHAKDKRQALRDIFQMSDSKAFLAKSGWRPAAA
jgi:hypothetical protein